MKIFAQDLIANNSRVWAFRPGLPCFPSWCDLSTSSYRNMIGKEEIGRQ